MRRKRALDWDLELLHDIADTHGTPTYVLDVDRAVENYERFSEAVAPAEVQYAAKTNPDPAIVSELNSAGASVECASMFEAKRIIEAGVPADDLHVTAVNIPDSQLSILESFVNSGAVPSVTLDSIDAIDKLHSVGFEGSVYLRVSAGKEGKPAKFGIQPENIEFAKEKAEEKNMEVEALHSHMGTGALSKEDLSRFFEVAEQTHQLAEPLGLDIDLGGGYGVPYEEDETPIDLDWFGPKVAELCERHSGNVILEPGRFIAADAGLLLTEVTAVKETGVERVIGLNAGFETLTRPMIYGAYHHIEPLTREERETRQQTVSGPTCESIDLFCESRDIREIQRDDIVALENAGAYGYIMGNRFHSQPFPACVAVKGDETALTIRRETMEDIEELIQQPDW